METVSATEQAIFYNETISYRKKRGKPIIEPLRQNGHANGGMLCRDVSKRKSRYIFQATASCRNGTHVRYVSVQLRWNTNTRRFMLKSFVEQVPSREVAVSNDNRQCANTVLRVSSEAKQTPKPFALLFRATDLPNSQYNWYANCSGESASHSRTLPTRRAISNGNILSQNDENHYSTADAVETPHIQFTQHAVRSQHEEKPCTSNGQITTVRVRTKKSIVICVLEEPSTCTQIRRLECCVQERESMSTGRCAAWICGVDAQ